MSEYNKKSNKKFMLLSAFGIIMVVDAHAWTTLSMFTDFMPYNSFFLPMFVFISGYFCKVDGLTDIKAYIKKRTKRLMVPFFCYILVTFCIELLINRYKIGRWVFPTQIELLDGFRKIFTSGMVVKIAEPLWFVPTLFITQCVFAVIKKYGSKFKIWNDYIAIAVFICMNVCIVHLSRHMDTVNSPFLLLLKCGFMLPFYELGIVYREFLEPRLEKINHLPLLLILLLINMVRIMFMADPYDIAFNDLAIMAGFKTSSSLDPLISSIVGIWFWLTVVEMLEPALRENRILEYISNNTYWILAFHVSMYNILNCILAFVDRHIIRVKEFKWDIFLTSQWYRWEYYEQFRLAYFAIGIVGTVLTKKLFDYLMERIRKKRDFA